jgi:putative FmdB family regulatory protein
MPVYEFHCAQCKKDVTLTLTVKEREAGAARCPTCRGALVPLVAPFYSKTSRKS